LWRTPWGDLPVVRVDARHAHAALSARIHNMFSTGGVAILWQIASLCFPDYLFPSIPQTGGRFVDIATSSSTQVDVLTTAARILAGLVGAFVCGVLLALVLNKSRSAEAYPT
jgi:ABC-type nitrate/sulfonate/bicarbonate transport system permease component